MSSLVTRDRQVVWHPYEHFESPPPIPITSAKGSKLITEDGKEIIDAISSWWVTIHGHTHPAITKAVTEQLQKMHHVIFSGFTHEPAVTLAERLKSKLPSNQSRIFYSDNGSTAIEVALKLCIQFWSNCGTPRQKVIALQNSYHGDTFGAMASSERGFFVAPFERMLFEVAFIPSPADNPDRTIEALKAELSGDDVACVLFEPLVQGAGGMRMYSPAVLNEMIRAAHAQNVPCIADEVMTGFGRLGSWFASSQLTELPDLLCLSKGLTGGTLPMGVTSCTDEIFKAFTGKDKTKTFFHGHSFTANPLVCAAANASFEILAGDEAWRNIARVSQHQSGFATLLKHNSKVSNPRSCGTIAAFDVITEENPSYMNPIKERLISFCLDKGVFIRPLGNIVYVMPPYSMTDEELLTVYDTVLEALEVVA